MVWPNKKWQEWERFNFFNYIYDWQLIYKKAWIDNFSFLKVRFTITDEYNLLQTFADNRNFGSSPQAV